MNGSIQKLRIEDERYYDVEVDLHEDDQEVRSLANFHRVVYVKQKVFQEERGIANQDQESIKQVLQIEPVPNSVRLIENSLLQAKGETQAPESFFAL